MNFPLPSRGVDPFYDAFISLMEAVDASAYAAREDRNSILLGGGTLTFSSSTGLLTWSLEISILAATLGFRWRIAAGSTTLQDGESLYVDLTRAPSTNLVVTPTVAAQTPSSDTAFLVAVRIGDRVYFRNGDVLINGQSRELIQTGGADTPGGSSGGGGFFARFSSVQSGIANAVEQVDVGVSTTATTLVDLAVRTDKAVTAGTMTLRVANQSGNIFSMSLTSLINAGVYRVQLAQPAVLAAGDLIALSCETDGSYTHSTGGLAAVKLFARMGG